MSTGRADAAHAMVAAFRAGDPGRRAWMIERAAVADRLDALIDEPDLMRQGGLNLCGPAALFAAWFARDPGAATSYAVSLYEEGRGRIGDHAVAPSESLLELRYGRTGHKQTCPPADWILMSALRDSTNRLLRYAHEGGPREAAAAITMPGAMRRWLLATGVYTDVRDETNLVRRKGMEHALSLRPAPEVDVFLLVAQEVFHRAESPWHRARDRVVSRFPNHWVLLRSPIEVEGEALKLRFWSWGTRYTGTLNQKTFVRSYFGALIAHSRNAIAAEP
jgi:hypothetical protein